jgi:nucleolar protein 6
MTDKETGKGKGIAFVEFHDWDTMNTALTKYHHSTFDDGLSPARKINVELS